ncbi:hypothetical protein WJX72_007222 [[Myrmecia] bisecta]|uniref:Nucleotide-diphospho-sugar transferase domain-containing protein n=1 Tax=[Myrmecia] bisecta TaxID=41462 RepID=A0AAW1Q4I2_9CHLO
MSGPQELKLRPGLGGNRRLLQEGADQQQVLPLVLTKRNYRRVMEMIATPGRQIIYTTFVMDGEQRQLQETRNFMWWLKKIGLMNNTIIISYDAPSCDLLAENGLPCWIDRAAPPVDMLKGQYRDRVPGWYQKYWWALKLAEANFTAMFTDNDAAIMRDPWPLHDTSYDIEGLSDFNWLPTPPNPKDMLLGACLIYRMGHNPDQAANQWLMKGGDTDPEKSTAHTNPCQSTGLWFAEPRDPTKRFFRDFLVWIQEVRLDQWDQAAWNESDLKIVRFKELGLWHAEDWDIDEGQLYIKDLKQNLTKLEVEMQQIDAAHLAKQLADAAYSVKISGFTSGQLAQTVKRSLTGKWPDSSAPLDLLTAMLNVVMRMATSAKGDDSTAQKHA